MHQQKSATTKLSIKADFAASIHTVAKRQVYLDDTFPKRLRFTRGMVQANTLNYSHKYPNLEVHQVLTLSYNSKPISNASHYYQIYKVIVMSL